MKQCRALFCIRFKVSGQFWYFIFKHLCQFRVIKRVNGILQNRCKPMSTIHNAFRRSVTLHHPYRHAIINHHKIFHTHMSTKPSWPSWHFAWAINVYSMHSQWLTTHWPLDWNISSTNIQPQFAKQIFCAATWSIV